MLRVRDERIQLLLIADNPEKAAMLSEALQQAGVNGSLLHLRPGKNAIDCARQSGACSNKPALDMILFDFTEPNDNNTAVLREMAFSKRRARIPVGLLTNPSSEHLLHAENICGDKAIMFSPTPLSSFVAKMRGERRADFFKAIATLYEYGPVLIELSDGRRAEEYPRTPVAGRAPKRVAYA